MPPLALRRTLSEDFRAYEFHGHTRLHWWHRLVLPLNPALTALVILRLSQWFQSRGLRIPARFFYVLNVYLCGCEIRPESDFGPGLFMGHPTGVIIGGVTVGRNAIIGPRVGIGGPDTGGWPTIGDNVTIYTNASILGSLTVGDDAVIGAHALVMEDVPPGTLVAGVPAKVVRRFTPEEIAARRRPADRRRLER